MELAAGSSFTTGPKIKLASIASVLQCASFMGCSELVRLTRQQNDNGVCASGNCTASGIRCCLRSQAGHLPVGGVNQVILIATLAQIYLNLRRRGVPVRCGEAPAWPGELR